MKKFKITYILVIMTALAVTISSCQKNETTPDYDSSISNDDAFAEDIFDNTSNIADEAYELGVNNLKSTDGESVFLSDCVIITLDMTASPNELIIDFGEENCLCNDGRYRRGKIIVTFTGRYKDPGTVITTGFEDYYVNDNNVDGSKVVTNMGSNELEQPYFTIEVEGVIVLADDAGTINWNASKVRTWIEGYETRKMHDDVYEIEGEAEGIRASGLSWEREILTPLRKELSCRWIVSGTVEIRPQDKPVRLLDFGDGECDNEVTITINGETYTITLQHRFKWRKG